MEFIGKTASLGKDLANSNSNTDLILTQWGQLQR